MKIPAVAKTIGNTALSMLIAAAAQALAYAAAKRLAKLGQPKP